MVNVKNRGILGGCKNFFLGEGVLDIPDILRVNSIRLNIFYCISKQRD